MTRPPLEQRLKEAGSRRKDAEDHRLAAAQNLHATVREAASTAGWTKVRIAKVAGISRQAVHDILKENQ